MHDPTTHFPGELDSRIYYSDVSLKEKDLLDGYNELIKQQKYKDASQYLYDNIEVPDRNVGYNGAYLWNMMTNRVVAIENEVQTIDSTLTRPYYGDTKPSELRVGMVWI